jgi:hypothetical protein
VEVGKYVFCEKPVDLDLERAKACVQHLGDHANPSDDGIQSQI